MKMDIVKFVIACQYHIICIYLSFKDLVLMLLVLLAYIKTSLSLNEASILFTVNVNHINITKINIT